MQASPGVREQRATRAVFLVAGTVMAAWAPLVPLAKSRLNLDEAALGTLLLCLGLGSVLTMPLAGGLAARVGCRRAILAAGTLALVALPGLAWARSPLELALALALLGAGIGTVDVVMNIQAVIVEKASGKAMMSGFHGLFSLGGIVGAGTITGLLSLGVLVLPATFVLVGLAALLLLLNKQGLLPYGGAQDTPAFAIPKGRVLLIGLLCFALFLTEGSVLDWSAVYLAGSLGMTTATAGVGYVAFSSAMTLGRLTGDLLVFKFGRAPMLIGGALIAAIGYAMVATAPGAGVAVAGFALVGIGSANAVPVLFTAAGAQTRIPANLAIAGVTTLGYAGILLGPASIGWIAQGSSLPTAFLLVSALLVGVAICGRPALGKAAPAGSVAL